MAMSAAELIEKAKDQRKRNRSEEALVSALAAAEAEPENSDAWWEVALSRIALNDARNAIIALEKTVELVPEADGAWARLGKLKLDSGKDNEAKDAFLEALAHHHTNSQALEGLSAIYAREDDKDQDEDEASILGRIEQVSYLDTSQLNRYGIIHYRAGRYHDAIKYWQQDIADATDPASRFNLGLAYSQTEVSQEADAIDMWRMVLARWDAHERANKSIESLLPRMLQLAKRARSYGETLLPEGQWYEYYLNPFQLLNPPKELEIDDFDTGTIQRLKKRVMREIELEDGALSWLPGAVVDRSRAIGLCEELMDDVKRTYHWTVYTNWSLRDFLSRGAHEHFLVREHSSEINSIIALEDDGTHFQEWLGEYFAPQFDRVLCKAMEVDNLVVLECLLDGRRWVLPSQADRCFQNARHTIDQRLEVLREAKKQTNARKPTLEVVQELLNRGNLLCILNLLPYYFEDFQDEAVELLRGIAVTCYNLHKNVDLSRQIVELTKQIRFCSKNVRRAVTDDIETLNGLIKSEREFEAKLTFGAESCDITKEGVRFGQRFISVNDVSTVRWGIQIGGERAAPIYDFLLEMGADDGRRISIAWKAVVGIEKQETLFQGLINASFHYILPSLVERTEKRLAAGRSLVVGPCTVSAHGLQFETKGWFSNNSHLVPWHRAQETMNNGEITIQDTQSSKAKVTFGLRQTDNAPLLRILVNLKNGKDV